MPLSKRFSEAVNNYISLWKQFPLVLLLGVLFAGTGFYMLQIADTEPDNLSGQLFWAILLLFPILSAIWQSYRLQRLQKLPALIGSSVAAIAIIIYVRTVVDDINLVEFHNLYSSGLWILSGLAILITLPYLRRPQAETGLTVWQHYLRISSAVLITGLVSGLLFAAITSMMAAVDFLLNARIQDEWYGIAWFGVVGLAGVPLFLSLLPSTTEQYQESIIQKLINLVIKFVALPTSLVYMGILYLYTGQIVFTQEWPEGTVAWWIIALSVIIFITYFYLIKPEQDKWESRILRWAQILLIPQMGILVWAMTVRVQAYGLTELRYLAYVYAVWITGNAIYYGVLKKRSVTVAFTSLIVLVLVTSVGPWGASAISKQSQIDRLTSLLAENSLSTEHGYADKDAITLADDSIKADIGSIAEYLVDNHGVHTLQPFTEMDVSTEVFVAEYRYERNRSILDTVFGVEVYNYFYKDPFGYSFINIDSTKKIDVSAYDYVLKDMYLHDYGTNNTSSIAFHVAGQNYRLKIAQETNILTIAPAIKEAAPELEVDLTEWITQVQQANTTEELKQVRHFEIENDLWKLKLHTDSASIDTERDHITYLYVKPLISKK